MTKKPRAAAPVRTTKRAGAAPKATAPAPLAAPALTCVRLEADAPELAPGRSERGWMDMTSERFAYRCTPLTMANASGWEIRCPCALQAVWFGGAAPSDLHVVGLDDGGRAARLATSHFGHGVLTFHTGWLFRTPPGWAVWARGAPNLPKDGIAPLDGLVETDWLPFPFTMNWRFTRPGQVRFEKGEPFCFVTLTPHGALDAIAPKLAELSDDPALKADYEAWSASRGDFNRRLESGDPQAAAQGWQRNYVQGRAPGEARPDFHLSKRRLKPPGRD